MERSQSQRAKILGLSLPGWLVLCLPAFFVACAVSRPLPQSPPTLPRATPAYVQWLERQSLYQQRLDYLDLVTNTPLQWRSSSVDAHADKGDKTSPPTRIRTLLEAAPTWLYVNPAHILLPPKATVWASLRHATPQILALGIQGIYIAPTAEHAGIWHKATQADTLVLHTDTATAQAPSSGASASLGGGFSRAPDDNRAVVSLRQAQYMGSEAEFEAFSSIIENNNAQMGSDILPSATGLGPDFMLATRGVRQFPGIYILLEVPKEHWGLLPTPREASGGTALTAAQAADLSQLGVVPSGLSRESFTWAAPGGWACTDEIRGVDGVTRRFVYRYDQSPHYPVLNWDTPAGTARSLLFASVIREVGCLRQTLAGLHTSALIGLDAATEGSPTMEPAPSALRDVSREVRRCGGWSVHWDTLPTSTLSHVQDSGADFYIDSFSTPFAEYALLTGDARPLNASLRRGLKKAVPFNRLVHGQQDRGVPLTQLYTEGHKPLLEKLDTIIDNYGWQAYRQPRALSLPATGLAAISLGLTPQNAASPDNTAALLQNQMVLLSFYAGMPGLLTLNLHDICAVLPTSPTARGCALPGAGATDAISTPTGQAAGFALTDIGDARHKNVSRHCQSLFTLLRLRQQLGLASWTLREVHGMQASGCCVLETCSPEGETLLQLTNFGAAKASVTLPRHAATMRIIWGTPITHEGNKLTIPPRSSVWLLG